MAALASAALATVALASTVTACGHSAAAPAGSGVTDVSCTNTALPGHGRYHDEVSVRVQIDNATARRARYALHVEMSVGHSGPATERAAEVTISGSVPPRASGELDHKLLTSGPVQQCRVTRVGRS